MAREMKIPVKAFETMAFWVGQLLQNNQTDGLSKIIDRISSCMQ
jgi:hypothetical protein